MSGGPVHYAGRLYGVNVRFRDSCSIAVNASRISKFLEGALPAGKTATYRRY
jgi:hypothetical protein